MSLLGLDVGTTGCKAAAFAEDGRLLASAYEEYDVRMPKPGWAELDSHEVWQKVRLVIGKVAAEAAADPVRAIAVSSMGEAMVPVTSGRRILGPSILCFDARGAEYVEPLVARLDNRRFYRINGNTWGNQFGLTKLLWVREHQPDLYRRADKFLLWGCFVSFMLGADPIVDYSLANRTLLFDLARGTWSDDLLALSGVDREKLPGTAPSGTRIGTVAAKVADELGLPAGVAIVTGAHDQCANAVGCGVIEEGRAMYGMGTFICAVPVFAKRAPPRLMIPRGLCTEHHAVRGKFVSFIYNQGGVLLKWCRDTFAAAEHRKARTEGRDVYDELLRELPSDPTALMVLPHFTATGAPGFISDTAGVMAGLHLDTTRGALMKGVLEGATYYIRECVESLPAVGVNIKDFRAVGGGSKSEAWIQLSADIMGRPFVRPRVTEAGALGAAILAGAGSGAFASLAESVESLVALDRVFEPDPARHATYNRRFERYRRLYPLMRGYLSELTKE